MSRDAEVTGFWQIATERSVVLRALRIALIVGFVLAIINHGDRLLTGSFDMGAVVKIILTFLVPYCVSTYSSVLAVRDRLQRVESDRK
ncbi:nitrate/nitrite transporter NrtS [Ruegeria sp.]|uniref:nitrate/nitrite transporter NrtS n=1 Tax=Ruegeria sp. TaxID=1879320 RepID=UPI00231AC37B|nr:nitrate/nitrite transporter NrtS [Ruegeria sp.]MDA7965618.1 nitrate/nitrite transporter NrtS [Ruegeria sp.]